MLDTSDTSLRSYGVASRLIQILQNISENSKSASSTSGRRIGRLVQTTVGKRKGDPISPTTFIFYLDKVLDSIKDSSTGVSVLEVGRLTEK